MRRDEVGISQNRENTDQYFIQEVMLHKGLRFLTQTAISFTFSTYLILVLPAQLEYV